MFSSLKTFFCMNRKLVKETLIEYVKKINSDFEQKK